MHDYMVPECITKLSIEDFFWFGKTDNLQWFWNLRFVCLTVAVSNAVSTKIKTIQQRRKCFLIFIKKNKKKTKTADLNIVTAIANLLLSSQCIL